MFPKMTESSVPTSTTAIDQLEALLGYNLPPLYRRFLLNSNGGRPAASLFPIVGLPLNEHGVINFFFGIAPQWPMYDLEKIFLLFQGRIPKGVLPIAENGGVDYICLDLRNGKCEVVYWDHRHFWGTGEWREGDLYKVSNSFAGFLASLRPNPY